MDEPDLEVLFHFLNVLVDVLFGRALLDDSIGSLDHSVGFGRVGLGFAMLNSPFQTEFLKGMAGVGSGAPTVFEGRQSELASIVGENLLDFEGKELQTAP